LGTSRQMHSRHRRLLVENRMTVNRVFSTLDLDAVLAQRNAAGLRSEQSITCYYSETLLSCQMPAALTRMVYVVVSALGSRVGHQWACIVLRVVAGLCHNDCMLCRMHLLYCSAETRCIGLEAHCCAVQQSLFGLPWVSSAMLLSFRPIARRALLRAGQLHVRPRGFIPDHPTAT
jgi:hypothetical protein